MKIERSTLFKLYYLCLIVVVIAGLAVHFMEAAHEAPEVPEVNHEGTVAPGAHEEEEAPGEAAHEAEGAHEAEAEEGFWWLHIPLFAAFFAFAGGVVLLALSKLGVYPLLKREETYYEEHSFEKGGER